MQCVKHPLDTVVIGEDERIVEDHRRVPARAKDEIRRMIAAAPERHRPFIITAIFTGMRMSELRGLSWDQVDFDRRVIEVVQRADRFNELGKPKSRTSNRVIPMAPSVVKELTVWKGACPAGPQNLVFPNGAGRIENHSNIYQRLFKPLLVENGIVDEDGKPRFGFHALRHAAASLFIEQGWAPFI